MDRNAAAQEALHNAISSPSMANYSAIFEGFQAKGIPADEIKPRENVFTFHAWRALGRSVRKGEHGVKVCTLVPMTKKDDAGEAQPIGRRPRMTTVFHLSQTDAIGERAEQRQVKGVYPSHDWAGTPNPRRASTSPDGYSKQQSDGSYYSEEFTRHG